MTVPYNLDEHDALTPSGHPFAGMTQGRGTSVISIHYYYPLPVMQHNGVRQRDDASHDGDLDGLHCKVSKGE